AGRQARIEHAEDGADVLGHAHVAVLGPHATQETAGVVVGAVERAGAGLHAEAAENRLEVRHATALVTVVAGGRVEQQRPPEVDRDRPDLQREASKRGGRFSRNARAPSRGSLVAYDAPKAVMPARTAAVRSVSRQRTMSCFCSRTAVGAQA